jgi:hypothetical protein
MLRPIEIHRDGGCQLLIPSSKVRVLHGPFGVTKYAEFGSTKPVICDIEAADARGVPPPVPPRLLPSALAHRAGTKAGGCVTPR